MSKAGVKFEDIKTKLMKDEEFKAEYEKLKPHYELIAQIIVSLFLIIHLINCRKKTVGVGMLAFK